MTADTYSNTLGLLLMATGNDNNSWGSNANTSVFQILEDAVANALTNTVTGGSLDLSGSAPPAGPSQTRYAALIFNGTLGADQTIIVPNLQKFWFVQNKTAGAYGLRMTTPSGSTRGQIATLGAPTGGAGYTAGTYTNVPLTGGSGYGAAGTVVVAAGAVTSVVVTNPGFGYAASDTLSAAAANIGGTGAGFSISVATINSASTKIPQNSGWQMVYCDGANNITVFPFNTAQTLMPDGSASAPPYSGIAEQSSGWYRYGPGDWRFAILGSDVLRVTASGVFVLGGAVVFNNSIFAAASGTVSGPGYGFSSEVTSGWYRISAGNIGLAMLGQLALQVSTHALTWTGATFAGTDLYPAAITTQQDNYNPTSQGVIKTLGSLVGGSGYVSGYYTGVPLTGGAGSGATANITVTNGVVTQVDLLAGGTTYAVGNTLSASNVNLGGSGSGFSINVATLLALQDATSVYLNPTTATVPITGLAGGTAGRELTLFNIGSTTIQFAANSASSTAANRFSNTFNLAPGQSIQLRYDGNASRWRAKNVATAFSSCAVAAVSPDLLIQNNAGTPNTKMDVSASEALLIDTNGNGIKFENVNLTIDSTVTGPNGCDTGTRGTNGKYFIWLVSDGALVRGVFSLSSSLATVLSNLASSGYSQYVYGKRIGAQFTDGSSNFAGIRQSYRIAEYVVGLAATAAYPTLSTGVVGSAIVAASLSAVSWANAIPATAVAGKFLCRAILANSPGALAPNNNYGAYNSTTNPPPAPIYQPNSLASMNVTMLLQSANVYWASSDPSGGLFVTGWEDAI